MAFIIPRAVGPRLIRRYTSMMSRDISITLDSIGLGTGMKIAVFGLKLGCVVTSKDIGSAWKVIPSGSTAEFSYPHETKIGVYYYTGPSQDKMISSQIAAAPGTTWNYLATSFDKQGTIQLDGKWFITACEWSKTAHDACMLAADLH